MQDGAIGELVTGRAHYYECMANRIMDKDKDGKDAKKDGCGWLGDVVSKRHQSTVFT